MTLPEISVLQLFRLMSSLVCILYCTQPRFNEMIEDTVYWKRISNWFQFIADIQRGVLDRLADAIFSGSCFVLYDNSLSRPLKQSLNLFGFAFLMKLGATITIKDCRWQHVHRVFQYSRAIDLSHFTWYAESDLSQQVIEKAIIVINHALEQGQDILNVRDELGLTPWDVACHYERVPEYKRAIRSCNANRGIWDAGFEVTGWHAWFADSADEASDPTIFESQASLSTENTEHRIIPQSHASGKLRHTRYRQAKFLQQDIEIRGELPEEAFSIMSNIAWKATLEPVILRAKTAAFIIYLILMSLLICMKHGVSFLLTWLCRLYVCLVQLLRL